MNRNVTKNSDLVNSDINRLLKYAVFLLSIPIFVSGIFLLNRSYLFLGMSFLVFSMLLIMFSLSFVEKFENRLRKLIENDIEKKNKS